MSRRKKITYLVLAVASVVMAACASPTAPKNDTCVPSSTVTCLGGYMGSGS